MDLTVAYVATLVAATVASGIWCAIDWLRSARVAPSRRLWWIVLAAGAVTALGVGLRYLLIPPHHAMYLDEPWYAEAACSLARGGHPQLCSQTWSGPTCMDYGKALGWPVIIAPWTLLFGCATTIGIGLNRILGIAAIALVILATRCAGGRWWQGLCAAALLAIHPTHVAWSATGETNVAAASALLCGVCGALWFLRSGRMSGAALSVFALALTTSIRPELLLSSLVAAAVVWGAATASRARRLSVGIAIATSSIAAAASALPLWSMNESISGGAFFSLPNIASSAARVVTGPTRFVHGIVLVAGVAGGVALARRQPVKVALLLGTALSTALIALAYDRFDERMLLAATVALLPLGGIALGLGPGGRRHGQLFAFAAVAVIALIWLAPLGALSQPPETQLLETMLASRAGSVVLPRDALVIAQQPAVLGAAGYVAMPTTEALANEERLMGMVVAGQPVYFLCDMFCEQGFAGGNGSVSCDHVVARFSLTPVFEETFHSRNYALYRLGPHDPNAPPPACPRAHSPATAS